MVEKAEKTTFMILHVDLQCSSCYKKVKKVICKFPQIRDQKYDEKANTVFITVVCCDPEKIRDKLCCKGCGVIKSIEIVEPQKPQPRSAEKSKEPEKPKPPPEKPKPPPEKPKEPEKPKPPPEKPKEPEKPKPPPEKPKEPEKPKPPPEKPKEPEKSKPPPEKPKEPPPTVAPAPPPKRPEPAPSLPPPPHIPEPEPVMVVPCYPTYPPQGFCCGPCSAGIPGGPCYGGWYNRPPPPPPPPPRPCYEPFFGCRCGQSRNYYGCRCECNNYCQLDDSSCSIM